MNRQTNAHMGGTNAIEELHGHGAPRGHYASARGIAQRAPHGEPHDGQRMAKEQPMDGQGAPEDRPGTAPRAAKERPNGSQ